MLQWHVARLHEALGVEAGRQLDLAAQRVKAQRAPAALHIQQHLGPAAGIGMRMHHS